MKRVAVIALCAVMLATPVCTSAAGSDPNPAAVSDISADAGPDLSAAADADTSALAGPDTSADPGTGTGTDTEQDAGTDTEPYTGLMGLIKEALEYISSGAAKIGKAIREAAADLWRLITDQYTAIADQAVNTMSGAVNVVIDGAGNLVNRASEGAGKVSAAAQEALDVITERGSDLISAADKAVSALHLEKPENAAKARAAIDMAIEAACDKGLIGKNLSPEAVQIIKDIVFGTTVYGYQYAKGFITLEEYASILSGIIIKEGLPIGVGYAAGKLPVPGAEHIAEEVTAFLIRAAYGEGKEEVLFEDLEQKDVQ